MNSLYQEQIKKVVIPQFKKIFSLKNNLEVPYITKVIVNTGIGRKLTKNQNNKELIEKISQDLASLTGQKPALRPARHSIASFKIRKGMPIGMVVTLRGKRMGDFIYKFINVVIPRIRDFWGIPLKNIDKQGNLNYGLKNQLVFPEISKEEKSISFGMEVTFVTNTQDREKAIELFRLLGFPLEKKEEEKADKNSR